MQLSALITKLELPRTIHRWIKYMGFSVQKTKKSYYVDGHEFPEQQKARIDLSKMYLTKLEVRCNRWIQMTLDEFNKLQSELADNEKIIHKGHEYERDDGVNIKSYQAMKYDNEGNLVKEFSLQYLLGQCADFQNEVSQLEFVCEQLGATALITPKYHAELAGEGIEYTWGFLKSIYRRYPLEKKKGKTQFEALLNQCLSRDLITKEIVRKFSRRARGYMEAYVALDINEEEEMYGTPIPHQKIEQLKKVLKSHRAAIDFDKEFIMKFVARDGFDIKEVGLDKKPAAVKSEKKNK